jgi:DNA-binding GntR family transcriptional regulator
MGCVRAEPPLDRCHYTEGSLVLSHDQFAVALEGLRERLRTPAGVRGESLTVNELAAACGVSTTPVREALAQLAGEGLIEDRRRRGYYAWRLDASDLADLYRAQETLTMTALDDLVGRRVDFETPRGGDAASEAIAPVSVSASGADAVLFWEALAWRVVREAGHRFLLSQQQRLSDRLAPARQLEPSVLREDAGELNGLAEHVNRRDWGALAADIRPFFTRRRAAASAIVEILRADLN